jgi:hypothetical protein
MDDSEAITAANLLGVEKRQLIKKADARFIVREDQEHLFAHCQRLFDTRAWCAN